MDKVDTKTRSRMMSCVRGKNTKLEIAIRKRLFAFGFRYRLHSTNLPGKPDITLKKYKTAIFFNGCFWHLHSCEFSSIPETRSLWWKQKLTVNKKRDCRNLKMLLSTGWRIVIVWECAVRKLRIAERALKLDNISCLIRDFLYSEKHYMEIDYIGKRLSPRKIGHN
jgi:DNA mismatch endonuclease (patch repair protein)